MARSSERNPLGETGIIVDFSRYRGIKLNEELRTLRQDYRRKIEDHLGSERSLLVTFKKPEDGLGADFGEWFTHSDTAEGRIMIAGANTDLIVNDGEHSAFLYMRENEFSAGGSTDREFNRYSLKEQNVHWLRFANALLDNIINLPPAA